jgi:hypothetical protein
VFKFLEDLNWHMAAGEAAAALAAPIRICSIIEVSEKHIIKRTKPVQWREKFQGGCLAW